MERGKQDGDKYELQFRVREFHVQEIFTFPSGENFSGEWKVDQSWNGKEDDQEGSIFGKFVNGE